MGVLQLGWEQDPKATPELYDEIILCLEQEKRNARMLPNHNQPKDGGAEAAWGCALTCLAVLGRVESPGTTS